VDFCQPVRDAYSSRSQQYIDLFADGGWQDHADDTELIRRHLAGLTGPVLDLGCGPGHWTAYLQSLGAEVTGVDLVPEFITHARETYPDSNFRLGSMTELNAADHSVAGILAWYSTIHLAPAELDRVLAEFRRLLAPAGTLVIGFFDSDDDVTAFDHKIFAAYRWPADVLAEHLVTAGFVELQRRQHQLAGRPDRKYAAIAARAS
jgi:SAM-dependent methyltransferase